MKRSADVARTVWRTAVVTVELSTTDYRHAHEAAHRCGLLWNHAVDQLHKFWTVNEQDPTTKELRHLVATAPAELLRLHAHTRQAITDDLLEAVATYRENRAAGRKTKAPWRKKQYRPMSFTARYGWRERDGRVLLSGGRGNPTISFATPEVHDNEGRAVKPGEWGEGRLCWDLDNRRWEWHVAYRTVCPPRLDPGRTIAVDLGIINPVTTCIETDDAYQVVVVNGRHARAVKHRRNTGVAGLARKESRCKEGSRQWRKYRAARKRIAGKASDQLRNFDHHVARHAAIEAQARDAGRVVVGDVRGIEQNTRKADKRRFGKDQRRRLAQWSRGRQVRYLAEKTGCEIVYQVEDYSSKTCPACLTRNRPSGRNYRCRECGFSCHRDAVGALNIKQRSVHGAYRRIDTTKPVVVRYLRAVPLGKACSTRPDPAHVAVRSAGLPTLTPQGRENRQVRCG